MQTNEPNNRMHLAIAMPTRERFQRCLDTIQSVHDTVDEEALLDFNVHMYVRADKDDPNIEKYEAFLDSESMENTVTFLKGDTGKYIGLVNSIYETAKRRRTVGGEYIDAFMCGTDDIIFMDKGWFETLEKLNSQTKWYVAWFNDGEKYEECAQVPIISKAVIDVLGEPLYSKLGHFYGDLWITMLAKHCGIAYYIPTHRIFHMTPKNGRVKEMDSTFIRVRMGEQILKDHKIFRDSSDDLTQAANKLKEAMKNG